MRVQESLDALYVALLSHPVIRTTELVRQDVNRLDGYLRVRCTLQNGDFLECAIHVSLLDGAAVIDDYRCQWMEPERVRLKRRWDNAPHFPQLLNFPHHCHLGAEDRVESATEFDLTAILNLIADEISAGLPK